MEQTAGLWATTYLVNYKGINPAIAAKFASFFYIGITAGRGISGFLPINSVTNVLFASER